MSFSVVFCRTSYMYHTSLNFCFTILYLFSVLFVPFLQIAQYASYS